jgi:hypothetical protein
MTHIAELTAVTLSPEQIETVQMASRFVPLRLRAEFMKGLGDNYRRDARCALP